MTHTHETDSPGAEPIAAGRLLAQLRLAVTEGALAMANKTATAKLPNGTIIARDTAAPSLSGSGVLYAVGQVRLVDSERVRYQIAGSEWTYMIPSDIAAWLKPQSGTWPSQAGTGAVYLPCLIRPDGEDGASMRVQVPGPSLNRDWGAEWIHSGPCPKTAAAIIMAAMPKPTEDAVGVLAAEGKPPAPAPSPMPEDPDDDDDDNDDEDDD